MDTTAGVPGTLRAETAAAMTRSYVSHPPRAGELIEVSCWCEMTTVLVDVEDVWSGITDSCGRKGCDPDLMDDDGGDDW